eukprot:1183499-Amorphochlora_amoeboformis.AAC.1
MELRCETGRRDEAWVWDSEGMGRVKAYHKYASEVGMMRSCGFGRALCGIGTKDVELIYERNLTESQATSMTTKSGTELRQPTLEPVKKASVEQQQFHIYLD